MQKPSQQQPVSTYRWHRAHKVQLQHSHQTHSKILQVAAPFAASSPWGITKLQSTKCAAVGTPCH